MDIVNIELQDSIRGVGVVCYNTFDTGNRQAQRYIPIKVCLKDMDRGDLTFHYHLVYNREKHPELDENALGDQLLEHFATYIARKLLVYISNLLTNYDIGMTAVQVNENRGQILRKMVEGLLVNSMSLYLEAFNLTPERKLMFCQCQQVNVFKPKWRIVVFSPTIRDDLNFESPLLIRHNLGSTEKILNSDDHKVQLEHDLGILAERQKQRELQGLPLMQTRLLEGNDSFGFGTFGGGFSF